MDVTNTVGPLIDVTKDIDIFMDAKKDIPVDFVKNAMSYLSMSQNIPWATGGVLNNFASVSIPNLHDGWSIPQLDSETFLYFAFSERQHDIPESFVNVKHSGLQIFYDFFVDKENTEISLLNEKSKITVIEHDNLSTVSVRTFDTVGKISRPTHFRLYLHNTDLSVPVQLQIGEEVLSVNWDQLRKVELTEFLSAQDLRFLDAKKYKNISSEVDKSVNTYRREWSRYKNSFVMVTVNKISERKFLLKFRLNAVQQKNPFPDNLLKMSGLERYLTKKEERVVKTQKMFTIAGVTINFSILLFYLQCIRSNDEFFFVPTEEANTMHNTNTKNPKNESQLSGSIIMNIISTKYNRNEFQLSISNKSDVFSTEYKITIKNNFSFSRAKKFVVDVVNEYFVSFDETQKTLVTLSKKIAKSLKLPEKIIPKIVGEQYYGKCDTIRGTDRGKEKYADKMCGPLYNGKYTQKFDELLPPNSYYSRLCETGNKKNNKSTTKPIIVPGPVKGTKDIFMYENAVGDRFFLKCNDANNKYLEMCYIEKYDLLVPKCVTKEGRVSEVSNISHFLAGISSTSTNSPQYLITVKGTDTKEIVKGLLQWSFYYSVGIVGVEEKFVNSDNYVYSLIDSDKEDVKFTSDEIRKLARKTENIRKKIELDAMKAEDVYLSGNLLHHNGSSNRKRIGTLKITIEENEVKASLRLENDIENTYLDDEDFDEDDDNFNIIKILTTENLEKFVGNNNNITIEKKIPGRKLDIRQKLSSKPEEFRFTNLTTPALKMLKIYNQEMTNFYRVSFSGTRSSSLLQMLSKIISDDSNFTVLKDGKMSYESSKISESASRDNLLSFLEEYPLAANLMLPSSEVLFPGFFDCFVHNLASAKVYCRSAESNEQYRQVFLQEALSALQSISSWDELDGSINQKIRSLQRQIDGDEVQQIQDVPIEFLREIRREEIFEQNIIISNFWKCYIDGTDLLSFAERKKRRKPYRDRPIDPRAFHALCEEWLRRSLSRNIRIIMITESTDKGNDSVNFVLPMSPGPYVGYHHGDEVLVIYVYPNSEQYVWEKTGVSELPLSFATDVVVGQENQDIRYILPDKDADLFNLWSNSSVKAFLNTNVTFGNLPQVGRKLGQIVKRGCLVGVSVEDRNEKQTFLVTSSLPPLPDVLVYSKPYALNIHNTSDDVSYVMGDYLVGEHENIYATDILRNRLCEGRGNPILSDKCALNFSNKNPVIIRSYKIPIQLLESNGIGTTVVMIHEGRRVVITPLKFIRTKKTERMEAMIFLQFQTETNEIIEKKLTNQTLFYTIPSTSALMVPNPELQRYHIAKYSDLSQIGDFSFWPNFEETKPYLILPTGDTLVLEDEIYGQPLS